MLRLVLGQSGVGCDEHRATLQGPLQQEPPGRHQVPEALGVGEGVAGAPGAECPYRFTPRSSGRQRLLPHLVSHLEGGGIENIHYINILNIHYTVKCKLYQVVFLFNNVELF